MGKPEGPKSSSDVAAHCGISTSLLQAACSSAACVLVISHVLPQPSRKIACPSRKEFSEGLTDGETWGVGGLGGASECEDMYVYIYTSSKTTQHIQRFDINEDAMLPVPAVRFVSWSALQSGFTRHPVQIDVRTLQL